MSPRNRRAGAADVFLSRALEASRRSAGPCGISAAGRDRVLTEATGRDSLRPFPALFTPWARLVAAGVLPLLVVGALLAVVGPPSPQPEGVTVETDKAGDFVVFTIANGDRVHYVTKSTRPDRFDRSTAIPVRDGEFLDRADSGQELVFYRID